MKALTKYNFYAVIHSKDTIIPMSNLNIAVQFINSIENV